MLTVPQSPRTSSSLLLALAAQILFVLSCAVSAAPLPVDGGLIEGLQVNDLMVFKGIPFAAAPVGPLRWHPPEAVAPWEGVRPANRFSPVCMQRGTYPESAPPEPMSEDCLYLNIWAPADAKVGKLPVMVWIYGGGLMNGTASTPLYAGDALAQRNVIVVTFNYRLGALGFLAHPELTRESAHHASGNYGLLDQLAALRWVQRNIATFGGDAKNVTVFGQSSGAISISALVASPLAKGLFQRAIGQSGGLFEPIELAPEFWLDGAEKAGQAFAKRAGAASLQDLRAKPAKEIIAARFAPNIVIDGYVLGEPPFNAFAEGRVNDVDLLIGSNAEEGRDFLRNRKVTAGNMIELLGQDFPPAIVSLIGPARAADDGAAQASFIEFETNMRFGWDMWAWARLHAAPAKRKTFLYRFAASSPYPTQDSRSGPTHGAEMPFVFDHLGLDSIPWTARDHQRARTLSTYWTNFARSGDPNGAGVPNWPAFTPKNQAALVIGENIHAGVLSNESELRAIDRLYSGIRIVLAYWQVMVFALGLLVVFLAWRAVCIVLRRRAARAKPFNGQAAFP